MEVKERLKVKTDTNLCLFLLIGLWKVAKLLLTTACQRGNRFVGAGLGQAGEAFSLDYITSKLS